MVKSNEAAGTEIRIEALRQEAEEIKRLAYYCARFGRGKRDVGRADLGTSKSAEASEEI